MTIENITYRCFYCNKRFTEYGRRAEIVDQVQTLLAEYEDHVINQDAKGKLPTTLDLIQAQAKCCDRPLILHTHEECGDY